MIQSHRGAGDLAPENTLESFAFAWEMGTVPEADVRLTSDGVFVAFHDPHLRRTPSGIPEEWRDLGIEATLVNQEWKVFLDTEEAIEDAIRYVEDNPEKEGKPKQSWPFVTPFAGLPPGGWTTYH